MLCYHKQELFIDDVNVVDIAKQYGTPCFIYSRHYIEQRYQEFAQAFAKQPHLICYAVKANSNIAILNILAKLGAGFDIVSQGELERVLAAGGKPEKIVFSGVGKTATEITRALDVGIGCFNVESAAELERIQTIAKTHNRIAPIALRINPNINAKTHPYIATGLKENKFGISIEQIKSLYLEATKHSHLKVKGIGCHIGSQLLETAPFTEALTFLLNLIDELKANEIETIDIGGGLGVHYHNENPPSIQEYAEALLKSLENRNLKLILEPGRALVANAGFLLTKVEYLKITPEKNFAIIDAGMNDLIRPMLYHAWHGILPALQRPELPEIVYDVVGPICESGDWIAKERPLKIAADDILAIQSCGAYGFCTSSNYNSRPRAAEVMIDKGKTFLIRDRETIAELFAREHLLPKG